ncbi:CLUMA_CG018641, isoform A [Clunio marinus]|uniref:CLUMA_CG018641, isoform A n=1 Tax=Clunio marinus TaxID=568069 RepID=A0A1J1J0G8_9DIPT|nr:CLUMA_CG018641, isoform A [Clunio marinus]
MEIKKKAPTAVKRRELNYVEQKGISFPGLACFDKNKVYFISAFNFEVEKEKKPKIWFDKLINDE